MSSKGANAKGEGNKSALVPRLRFPEFRAAEDWKLEPLGSLAKRRTAKNTKGEHTRVLTNSAEFGVVDQRNYFDKDIANQGNLDGYYIVEKGDYVYNPRISTSAPVGPISKNNVGTGVMSPLYTVFRFVSSNNDFFAHYFKSTHWHRYMRQASSTGARHDRMSLTNDGFMGLPLPISIPKEQQKIADCLSSLDHLVTAESKKLDAIKDHKKGLMQQLFPREGETVPRLRFPEFRDAGEWEAKSLEEIAPLQRGFDLPSNELQPGNIPVVYSNGVQNFHSKAMTKAPGLVTGRSGTIGKLHFIENGEYWPHNTSLWVTSFRGNIPKFVYFLFNSIGMERFASGSGVPTLNRNDVHAFVSAVPKSLAEQQRIADCLSSLDSALTAQSQKVAALKTHKQGLMQQLFPVLDEVHV